MFIVFGAAAIIAFGILIAIHELGHFTAAKLLGVRVNEFAIGMGPRLLKKQGKETVYSLRALPFGGFCALEGDNDVSEDPRAFISQKRWRRIIILAAGSIANFVAAFIVIVVLTAGNQAYGGTTIVNLVDGFPNEGVHGLMAGDKIVSINGEKLYYADDFRMFMGISESRGVGVADLVIQRGSETITLNRFPLEQREYTEDGETNIRYGITFNRIEASAIEHLKFSGYTAMNYVRLIRVSLAMLFSGAAGIQDFTGPVGIVDTMIDIGQTSALEYGILAAFGNIVYFMAFIGVNLAVVNMLPIPAMDGGRILFTIISWVIEKITRRKLDPKYERYINTAAFLLLMGFMIFVVVNDVVKIINR